MDKKATTIISIFLGALTILFSFFFYKCIENYHIFNTDYSKLTYCEVTYQEHTFENDNYEFYFNEFDLPLKVAGIADSKVNIDILNKVNTNDTLQIYYLKDEFKKNSIDLFEIKVNDQYILSLQDCKAVNMRNQKVGMILCPIMIICTLFLLVIAILSCTNMQKYHKNFQNNPAKTLIGTLRLEHIADGHRIQIFNSPSVCSLIIDGELADKYVGFVASTFILKGSVVVNEKEIEIKVKMGAFNLKLYYDNKLVGKVFLGLG